ncbi:NAD(+)/NADH kinase [Rhodophyticola sp. MJ-SS7]|nr:NAD(+)/NADH kinase [Rhodophyticola sp. MJ-SS7]
MRIGLLVNPIAGLGGAVGLKGTDGPGTVAEALARGAEPHAGERTRRAFERLASRVPGTVVHAAAGALGAEWLNGLDLDVRPVPTGAPTGTARDTRRAAEALADANLIVFSGGDGTARDVTGCLGPHNGVLGIPCGVKMHSGVFAISPEAAGALLADLVTAPDRIGWDDAAEVMDIDEETLRKGRLAPRLFGHARVPVARRFMQASKGGPATPAADALAGAARDVVDGMEPGVLYVIGPGTSAGAVLTALGEAPTLLGIDAVRDGHVVARDANAATLEELAATGPVRIVLGVTGQQGFLLGRGNQQISPALIAHAGRDDLIVLATEDKLAALAQPCLWVDTGDPKLDEQLAGYLRVKTGRGRETMMRIGAS